MFIVLYLFFQFHSNVSAGCATMVDVYKTKYFNKLNVGCSYDLVPFKIDINNFRLLVGFDFLKNSIFFFKSFVVECGNKNIIFSFVTFDVNYICVVINLCCTSSGIKPGIGLRIDSRYIKFSVMYNFGFIK